MLSSPPLLNDITDTYVDSGVLAQLYDPMPSWLQGIAAIFSILIGGIFLSDIQGSLFS